MKKANSPNIDNPQIWKEFMVQGFEVGTDVHTLQIGLETVAKVANLRIAIHPKTGLPMGKATVIFYEPVSSSTLENVRICGRKLQCKRINSATTKGYELPVPSNTTKEVKSFADISSPIEVNSAQTQDIVSNCISPQAEWFALTNDTGDIHSALVKYSQEASDQILKNRIIESNKTPVANIVADNLIRGGVLAQAGWQAGQVFQIVGNPTLIAGIQSGAYTQMAAAQGLLTGVRSAADGTIVGQLGLVRGAASSIVGPTIAWQILNAVAGTIQLQRINERLDRIQSSLDRLLDRDENRDLGEILHAIKTLSDLREEYYVTGRFSTIMSSRLANAESAIGKQLQARILFVDAYQKQRETLKASKNSRNTAVAVHKHITEEQPLGLRDVQMMASLMRADIELQHTFLLSDLADDPENRNLQRRQGIVKEKMVMYSDMLSHSMIDTEDLKEKAQDCVENMRFWEGRFGLRSTIQKLNSESGQKTSSAEASISMAESTPSEALFLWRDSTDQWFIASNPNMQA